jgi:hypothetical protein
VSPVIGEVVLIDEFTAFLKIPPEYHLAFIEMPKFAACVMLRVAVALAPDAELVQMGIRPAHGRLQIMMQFAKTGIAINDQSPPYGRFDSEQLDVQGKYGVFLCHERQPFPELTALNIFIWRVGK